MGYTLAQMRSRVQAKLNNVGSGNSVIFQPAEIDNNVNAGIKYVGYVGDLSIIEASLYKYEQLSVSGGYVTKPTDYFRFGWARVDGRRGRLINPDEYDDLYYDEYRAPGTKNKYLVDYDGTKFQVLPDTAASVYLHYIATLTDLTGDGDASPLKNVGDDIAIDWAFALCLESKGFKPEIANQVFNRVYGMLGVGK